MKILNLINVLIIIFFCDLIIAQTIVVVNIQSLIDNNKHYIEKIKNMEASQQKYFNNFTIVENELEKMLNEIEETKLLLNDNELNIRIDKYNIELSEFQILIEDFNIHYQKQILTMRESILKEIILILELYASKNQIDLILDSTSYLIASNSIDISENIKKELEKINFKLEYKDFEKN